jgi:hypothetical protein
MAKVKASVWQKTEYTGASDDQLTTDGSGNLNVAIVSGGGSGGTASSFAAAFPATGTAVGASDGTNMQPLLVDGSGYLEVNVKAGSGGGVSIVDEASATAGSSVFVPAGGVFNDSFAALTSGQQGLARVTANRGIHANLRNASGTEIATLSNPARVDPTGSTTQPVSASSLPLPAGASTSAKQPALGTAGSAAADVISVQGIASMTKLLVTPDSVALPSHQSVNVDQLNGTTTDTNSGNKSAGTLRVVLATDQPALINKLLVTPDLPTGASTAAKQPALGTAGSASSDVLTIQGIASMTKLLVTPDSVALPANQSCNVAQINGITPLMGNGVTGTGSLRVTLASDTTTNSNPFLFSAQAITTGGLSISRTLSANNTTGINAKNVAGQVYGWTITNINAAARFVKLYNKASAPTVGTDTPVITLAIPGNTAGAGMVAADFSCGITFGTGIGYGITTGVADNDTGAPAANEVVVNLFYK